VGIALAAPAAAGAAVVEVRELSCDRAGCTNAVAVVDAAGERNDLTITREDRIVVRDAAAPLRAGNGCAARGDGSVACAPEVRDVLVEAGGGDDVLRAGATLGTYPGAQLGPGDDRYEGGGTVDGGPGRDELRAAGPAAASFTGGADDDVLVGGERDDSLTGGPGRDVLLGGAGSDRLSAWDGALDSTDVPAADRLDGGAGTDLVDYTGRTAAVVVDLADALPEGAPGEGDAVAAVENVTGGDGDDRLRGDAGANFIDGGLGRDAVAGRSGDDQLGSNAGRRGPDDVLSGGAGNDTLTGDGARVADGGSGADLVGAPRGRSAGRCGPGRDVVDLAPGALAALARDCERWSVAFGQFGGRPLTVPRSPRRGAVRLGVPCDSSPTEPSCTATLRVTVLKPRFRRARAVKAVIRRRARRTLAVRLTRRERAAARRRDGLRVRLDLALRDTHDRFEDDNRFRGSIVVTLRG
jgi:hypothetical protein